VEGAAAAAGSDKKAAAAAAAAGGGDGAGASKAPAAGGEGAPKGKGAPVEFVAMVAGLYARKEKVSAAQAHGLVGQLVKIAPAGDDNWRNGTLKVRGARGRVGFLLKLVRCMWRRVPSTQIGETYSAQSGHVLKHDAFYWLRGRYSPASAMLC
jgi:hypothetical protein